MNFKQLLVGIAAIVLIIVVYKFATRVDRTNPAAVANAFTKAMNGKDFDAASTYYVPDQATAWLATTEETVGRMKSGAKESFYERIPDAPAFASPVTAAGVTTIVSPDPVYTLEMKQVDGKWYVSKSPV